MSAPAARIPQNHEAEESLVGAMLLSRIAADDALEIVRADDLYSPELRRIFGAVAELRARGEPMDEVVVASRLAETNGGAPIGTDRLRALMAAVPASANVASYARAVVAVATRRALIAAAERISEAARSGENADGLLAYAMEAVENADFATLGGKPDPNVAEWLDMEVEPRWVLPGLLQHGDRVLIVAGEGQGKSTLLRQLAVCISAGLHPFRFYSITALRVILLDFENPEGLVRAKVRGMVENLLTLDHGFYDADKLRVVVRGEGIDLASRADERWLFERVAANARAMGGVDVICVGPVYKMDLEADEKAPGARRVTHALDRLRARYDCALVMETHAPHESFHRDASKFALRPAGPRLWLRWPEFCKGVQDAEGMPGCSDFWDIRPGRDERDWPRLLRKGGRWPWSEEGYDR